MSKGTGQFQNTWQLGVQGFFTQVVQLQEYVVGIFATATAFQNFQNHRTGHNVTTSKVFSVRRITFHETLTVFVDQVTTFTTTAFSNQYTSAGNTGWVELPHFHILHRHAGTDRHTNTVTSVDQSIGSGLINTAGTAGRQNSRFGFNENSFAGFDFDGDNTSNLAFFVFHQINGVPFVQEGSTAFQVTLIQGVQQSVTSTVSSSTGTGSLATLTEIFGLTTERTLINTTFFSTGERQTHVVQFKYRLRTNGTHIFNCVLVTDVVGTFYGVVHVPAPIVIRISGSDCTGNTALRRYSVRTGWENLGNTRCVDAGFGQLQCCTHTCTTTTNHDCIK